MFWLDSETRHKPWRSEVRWSQRRQDISHVWNRLEPAGSGSPHVIFWIHFFIICKSDLNSSIMSGNIEK